MAITLVQAAHSTSSSTSFASNITAGNAVIVCVAIAQNSSITGITPASGGDSYTQKVDEIFDNIYCGIWVVFNSSGGYKQITPSLSVGSTTATYIYEVSGIGALDLTSHNGSSTTNAYDSGSTATTTYAQEFWVGIGTMADGSGFASITGATGWTNEPTAGSSFYANVSGYQIKSSTGAARYNGTGSGSIGNLACVATFSASVLSVSLPVSQLTLAAPLPQPPVILPVAQLDLAAFSLAIGYGLPLPVAQLDLAGPAPSPRIELTLLCALAATAGTDDSGSTYGQGFTGRTRAFQPNTAPVLLETVHTMPAMSASWATGSGGVAQYQLNSAGNLEFAFVLRTIGTRTDGTTIWAAGSLPAGYQPPEAKYWPAVVIGSWSYSAYSPSVLFGTDGSVKIYGISANIPTGIDIHGILPLNL